MQKLFTRREEEEEQIKKKKKRDCPEGKKVLETLSTTNLLAFASTELPNQCKAKHTEAKNNVA